MAALTGSGYLEALRIFPKSRTDITYYRTPE